MKLLLIACIFFAGVYFGLHADPEGEVGRVVEQLQGLIHGEPEW
jgi:hypothetical protein